MKTEKHPEDMEASSEPTSFASVEARFAREKIRSDQDLTLGALAGAAAALAGAGLWALTTWLTGYQIGFMAIGIGVMVGFAVRKAGKGIDPIFGVLGAVLSALGCAAGNLWVGCIFLASQQQVGIGQVFSVLDVALAKEIVIAMFSPMDLLFYGLALYEGYRFSLRSDVSSRADG